MQLKAGLSKVTRNKRAKPVHCNPLESMLHRAPGWTAQVSLWSLDVEGHEMVVLNGHALTSHRRTFCWWRTTISRPGPSTD